MAHKKRITGPLRDVTKGNKPRQSKPLSQKAANDLWLGKRIVVTAACVTTGSLANIGGIAAGAGALVTDVIPLPISDLPSYEQVNLGITFAGGSTEFYVTGNEAIIQRKNS